MAALATTAAVTVVGAPAAGARPGSAASAAQRVADPAAQVADDGYVLELTRLVPAVPAATDTLTISGRVRDIGGTQLTELQVYLRLPATPLRTRAELAGWEAAPKTIPQDYGILFIGEAAPVGALTPGRAAGFSMTVPAAELPFTAAGVYPLTFELRGTDPTGARVAGGDLQTYLPWGIRPPNTGVPGTGVPGTGQAWVGWLVPITAAPTRLSSSVFVDDSLAASLAPTGRLARIVRLLLRLPPAGKPGDRGSTVQVVIDPLVLSEVETMARGYRVADPSSTSTTGRSAALPGATAPAVASLSASSAPAPRAPRSSGTPRPAASAPRRSPAAEPTRPSPGSASPRAATQAAATIPTAALADPDLPAIHTSTGTGSRVAATWLASLARAVRGRTVLVLPWSDPDLATVTDGSSRLDADLVAGLWTRGLGLVRALGASAVPLTWPSLGTDTAAELRLAARAGSSTVLLPSAALEVAVPGASGVATGLADPPSGSPTTVVPADTALDTALAATTNPLLGRQIYLAQTALLTAGRRGPTSVLTVLPRLWDPRTLPVGNLFNRFVHATWLRQAPVVGTAPRAAAGAARLRADLPAVAAATTGDPAATPAVSGDTRRRLAGVAGISMSLQALLTQPAAVLAGLAAQRLPLASVELMADPRRWAALARSITATVTGIDHAISLVPPKIVSLSSDNGSFPVLVTNNLDQAVTVRISMSTANQSRLKVASVGPVRLAPHQATAVRVQADTAAHGEVLVSAVLEDRDQRPLSAPVTFSVHSNSYDQIGWVIIVVACALLFGATVVRLARRIHTHARNRTSVSTPDQAAVVDEAAVPTPGLGRSSAVMAVGTALSRVTGFARSVVIIAALGTATGSDAFTIANTIPNNLYILVAGGALNAVFIPQLVRAMRNDADGGTLFAQRLLTMTLSVLAVVSIVAVVAAPWLVELFTPSSYRAPAGLPYLHLSVSYARWCLPQILFYGLFVIVSQILNARGRFGPMMFAPILNNVVAVVVFGVAIALGVHGDTADVPHWQVLLLAGGSTLGVVVQAAVLLPTLVRAGVPLVPRLGWRHTGLSKVGRLAGWTLLFVLANQIAYVVVTRITAGLNAQTLGRGARSSGAGTTVYQNAFLIFQLPHAIVAVSLVTALLPRMSRSAAAGAAGEVAQDLSSGLKILLTASIPAAALFAVLGRDIAISLFSFTSGGRIGVPEAAVIGDVLSGFALAALVFSSQYLLLRGFYAFEDTRTPFLVQVVIAAVNIAGALAGARLAAPRGPVAQLVAVALAYGVAYVVGIALSAGLLRRRVGRLDLAPVARTAARLLVAAAVAALVALAVDRALHTALPDVGAAAVVRLAVAGAALLAVYVLLARELGVGEIENLVATVRRRLPARWR